MRLDAGESKTGPPLTASPSTSDTVNAFTSIVDTDTSQLRDGLSLQHMKTHEVKLAPGHPTMRIPQTDSPIHSKRKYNQPRRHKFRYDDNDFDGDLDFVAAAVGKDLGGEEQKKIDDVLFRLFFPDANTTLTSGLVYDPQIRWEFSHCPTPFSSHN